MSDGGFEWSLYEIFELAMVTSMLLIIGGAIFLAPDVNFIKAKVTANEVSYLAELTSNTNFEINTKYPETELKLNTQKNEITAIYKKKEATTNYFGNDITIKQISPSSQQITSN